MLTAENWDATEYLRDLCEHNRLAQAGHYRFGISSGTGWDGLGEAVSQMRNETAFMIVDETADTETREFNSGWFETTVHTVFILKRYKKLDEQSRLDAIKECRLLKKQFISRFIVDAEQLQSAMIYLDHDVGGREIGQAMLNGLTGLYFTFSFYRPEDLVYNPDDWTF